MTFGYISQKASSVTAPRRARVAVETTRVARRSNGPARQALGVALVTIGQRIAGELPAAQTNSDCA
jgi:hypothetical protein